MLIDTETTAVRPLASYSNSNPNRPEGAFEEEGEFFVGRIENEGKSTRVLCFRCRSTRIVGASRRFNRKEAYRKCKNAIRRKLGLQGMPEARHATSKNVAA